MPENAPEKDAIVNLLREKINTMLNTLEPLHARILRLHFGLESEKKHTLQVIADILRMTRETVRRIEQEALRILRKKYSSSSKEE